jgi:hypothetical protein
LAPIFLLLALLLPASARADQRELDPYRLRFRKTAVQLADAKRLERERKAAVAEMERIIRDATPWWCRVAL